MQIRWTINTRDFIKDLTDFAQQFEKPTALVRSVLRSQHRKAANELIPHIKSHTPTRRGYLRKSVKVVNIKPKAGSGIGAYAKYQVRNNPNITWQQHLAIEAGVPNTRGYFRRPRRGHDGVLTSIQHNQPRVEGALLSGWKDQMEKAAARSAARAAKR